MGGFAPGLPALIDVPVSSRAAIADFTAARGALLDRLALLAAGGAGEATPARMAALDALLATGLLRAGTTQVNVTRPANASGGNCTAGGVAWTKGSYVILAAAADLALHDLIGLTICPTTVTTVADLEIDIARGAPGSEIVIATFHMQMQPNVSGQATTRPYFLPVPVQILANAAVSARIAASTASYQSKVTIMALPRPF